MSKPSPLASSLCRTRHVLGTRNLRKKNCGDSLRIEGKSGQAGEYRSLGRVSLFLIVPFQVDRSSLLGCLCFREVRSWVSHNFSGAEESGETVSQTDRQQKILQRCFVGSQKPCERGGENCPHTHEKSINGKTSLLPQMVAVLQGGMQHRGGGEEEICCAERRIQEILEPRSAEEQLVAGIFFPTGTRGGHRMAVQAWQCLCRCSRPTVSCVDAWYTRWCRIHGRAPACGWPGGRPFPHRVENTAASFHEGQDGCLTIEVLPAQKLEIRAVPTSSRSGAARRHNLGGRCHPRRVCCAYLIVPSRVWERGVNGMEGETGGGGDQNGCE